jgi:uncharacterized protein (TIGR02300 family)
VAKAELGVKRRCLNCNAPFFDLNRVPIVCPKCHAVFQVVEMAHSPARRAPIRRADPVIADLVLPVGEETGEESTIPPIEEDDEMEEVEEIIEIERDDKAPGS